ncbi:MAG: type I phosphomannose isomerase catalytic subunit [Candidatus Rariloculaceae bacterium]
MCDALTEAQALLDGDEETLARVASSLLKPLRDNCVERPWGGSRIREFKGLDQNVSSAAPLGEAFEIAAFNDDAEARQYPSLLRFADGSDVSLATAIERQADGLLGRDFAARFGACIPLLPKLLNVKELLSVQGHPEGNTEVYVIIDAEPGATLRVGFREDIDPGELSERLIDGRRRQETLQAMLAGVLSADAIQELVSPWFAERETGFEAIAQSFEAGELNGDELRECLVELKILYWHVLDAMNEIPVSPGQVIYNANPQRITAETGKQPSAEVHALGNPEKKEVLALEIRRPGPTFRAWDNVRFPIRDIDIQAAIAALNLQATSSDEYIVEPTPVAERAGVFCSVDSAAFRVEHLRPSSSVAVEVPEEAPHFLFAIGGSARVVAQDGRSLGDLRQGESAVVPIGVGSYRVESTADATEIIKASLPVDA